MKKNMIFGAIKGRHDLPVDNYIFEDAVVDPLDLEGIYNVVEKKLGNVEAVTLYVTGLTVVTTSVMKYCFNNNIALTLMHFDRDANNYYPQVIIAWG